MSSSTVKLKVLELPALDDADVAECRKLAISAAEKKSAKARAGRDFLKVVENFLDGFMGERALALFVNVDAYLECRVQQFGGSKYGPDFLTIDVKTAPGKYENPQLLVKNHVLRNDKTTEYYALVLKDGTRYLLGGWVTKDEMEMGDDVYNGESKSLRLSELRPADTFLESCT